MRRPTSPRRSRRCGIWRSSSCPGCELPASPIRLTHAASRVSMSSMGLPTVAAAHPSSAANPPHLRFRRRRWNESESLFRTDLSDIGWGCAQRNRPRQPEVLRALPRMHLLRPPQLLASTRRAVAITGTEISPSLPDHQCVHEKTNSPEVLRSVADGVALPDDVKLRHVWRCPHCGHVDRIGLVNARHVHPAIVRRIETWLAGQERQAK